MTKKYRLGLDVGSTTAKCVVLDEHGELIKVFTATTDCVITKQPLR